MAPLSGAGIGPFPRGRLPCPDFFASGASFHKVTGKDAKLATPHGQSQGILGPHRPQPAPRKALRLMPTSCSARTARGLAPSPGVGFGKEPACRTASCPMPPERWGWPPPALAHFRCANGRNPSPRLPLAALRSPFGHGGKAAARDAPVGTILAEIAENFSKNLRRLPSQGLFPRQKKLANFDNS
jgi:hypothetical protein